MNDQDMTFNIDEIFGHVEIKSFDKVENGRYYNYSYSINYDRHGKEISRTEPTSFGSIGFDNGEPVTQEYIDHLKYGTDYEYPININLGLVFAAALVIGLLLAT